MTPKIIEVLEQNFANFSGKFGKPKGKENGILFSSLNGILGLALREMKLKKETFFFVIFSVHQWKQLLTLE